MKKRMVDAWRVTQNSFGGEEWGVLVTLLAPRIFAGLVY